MVAPGAPPLPVREKKVRVKKQRQTPESPAREPRTRKPRADRPPRRKLPFVLAGIAAFLALLGGSFGAGWITATQVNAQNIPKNPPATVVEVPALDPLGSNSLMPDVRGLSDADAMQVLADAGIAVSTVTTTTKPAAGTSGIVIEQTPAFGTEAPTEVALVVSSPAEVPDLVGTDIDAAIADLALLGTGVNRVGTYDPDKKVGEIVAVSPKPGSPLPVEVELTVNVSPTSVFLSEIRADQSSCSTGALLVAGNTSQNALECNASTSSPANSAWLVAAAADRFVATVGIPDSEPTTAKARIDVLVDGKKVATVDVVWGKSEDIEIDVSGALKLELQTVSSTTDYTNVGLLDARLLGDPTAMQKLQGP